MHHTPPTQQAAVAIVTGATHGIGLAIAKLAHLAPSRPLFTASRSKAFPVSARLAL